MSHGEFAAVDDGLNIVEVTQLVVRPTLRLVNHGDVLRRTDPKDALENRRLQNSSPQNESAKAALRGMLTKT